MVKPQPIVPLWPSTMPGEPGEVAPRMSKPGPTRRARYQVPGKVSARCGSLASSGLPDTECAPDSTHSFEASRLRVAILSVAR